VGFDNQRRDSITVSSLPFRVSEVFEPEDAQKQNGTNLQILMRQGIRSGLLGLVVLLFFFLVLRPFLKWATVGDMKKEIELLPRTLAELEAARRDQGVLSLTKAAARLEEGEPLDKQEEEELRRKIMEKLGVVPKKGVRVVQEWLEDETLNHNQQKSAPAQLIHA
jgi:flagellar biosynthesis/type III secretory pathway M-ring protein FliF/YscJ